MTAATSLMWQQDSSAIEEWIEIIDLNKVLYDESSSWTDGVISLS